MSSSHRLTPPSQVKKTKTKPARSGGLAPAQRPVAVKSQMPASPLTVPLRLETPPVMASAPVIPYASGLHLGATSPDPVETPAVPTAPAAPKAPTPTAEVPTPQPPLTPPPVRDMAAPPSLAKAAPSPTPAPVSSPAPAIIPKAPAADPAPAKAPPVQVQNQETLQESDETEDVPETPPAAPPLLFEIAWEVCWQLGGIYTVLRTKAAAMTARWGDRYCLVGPYNPNTAAVEFEEQAAEGPIRQALERMREIGLPCRFGRWLVAGRPRAILIDYRARFRCLDADKYLLWKDHGISTVANDSEMNDVVALGFSVAELFRYLSEAIRDRAILAHFHEWMGGLAVPRMAHMRLPVATVFTTHATLLGRYLASDSPDFYQHLPFLDPDREATKYNIFSRYQIERAAAHSATVFTTVSEVTATEAEKLLGRHPEVILPNGLNIQRFAALHEFQNLHRQYKDRIHEFVMGHFFPSYTFDLDRTIYLVTSGRYEYRNKGMDLFIEAMAGLNQRLKQIPDPPTVVAFIVTRAATRHINVSVLQNQTMFEDLRNTCTDLQEQMGQRLFEAAVRRRIPTFQELLADDAQVRLKRAIHAWRSSQQPLIVTHDLVDDANDPILRHLRHRGLFNAADDPVKMIFHPEFATATAPPLNMDYEQFVRGCHMGIFPSYYEPWGYTPMECAALGLPAVTTDLSGFGAYVRRHIPDNEDQGIMVLNRRTGGFDQSTHDLVNYLTAFCQMTRRQRIELRNRVERLSEVFDWSHLVRHYHEAHDLALDRKGIRRPGALDVRLI